MRVKTSALIANLRKQSIPFLRENAKLLSQFVFTLFFIGLAIWFVKHQRSEIKHVSEVLKDSSLSWVGIGIALTVVYVLLQALMYVASFKAVGSKVTFSDALILFLKRNFISVFLPAGGISSLAFFTTDIEKKGISKSQIHFASSVYGFVGILSVVIIAIPAFLYGLINNIAGAAEWYALGTVLLLVWALIAFYRSVLKEGRVYRLMKKLIPASVVFMDDLRQNKIERKGFVRTTIYSILIEIAGISHLYIAMEALGIQGSLMAATLGYIVSVIFLIVSPFLRGLGAIEVSMTFVLTRFGVPEVHAIGVTLLYRFLEFWLPLLFGAFSFLLKVNRLLMRILPAFLLLSLGIINIISVLTPTITARIRFLRGILPGEAITISNYFVLMSGLFLLVTAAFMLKGLRSAWFIAIALCCVSIIGNIAKAIDYEEATVALVTLVILIASRKEYYIKINPKLRNTGIQTTLLSIGAVLLYGILGFYFLDSRHFGTEFNLVQAIRYTLENYVLLGSNDLVPQDHFARNFIHSINISGLLSIAFFLYTIISPYVFDDTADEKELDLADSIRELHGKSASDYFKTYFDKLIFISKDSTSFLAYRVSGNFAVVLENPIAKDEEAMEQCIREFDNYCYQNGLKSIFYRVPETSVDLYRRIGKKMLFLGQEAVVDLNDFSLAGGAKKSMRNALKKVSDRGYRAIIHKAPHKDGFIQRIKAVSDEWLHDTGRKEIIFSQGMFLWDEIKLQDVITVQDEEEKIVAFLNIIPDFVKGEGTYDLIRKTADAPNGVMDFILVELFNHLKEEGYHAVNLGFAPLGGIEDARTFSEKSMKFAYEKIRTFAHYKGLREYKEKFGPSWTNQYLVYDQDFDLLQVPAILNKVIKV